MQLEELRLRPASRTYCAHGLVSQSDWVTAAMFRLIATGLNTPPPPPPPTTHTDSWCFSALHLVSKELDAECHCPIESISLAHPIFLSGGCVSLQSAITQIAALPNAYLTCEQRLPGSERVKA